MAMREQQLPQTRQLAVVGNYLPRQCGIATFTTDLSEALAARYTDTNVFALPVNDIPGGYSYPERVRFELVEQDLKSYRRAADFLNISNVDLVCLQHEYGIFGGTAGSHILALLNNLRTPIVTTLHTVLRSPNPHEALVMEELTQLSDRLVVMSEYAVEILQETYRIPREKIALIPHGIPDVPFVDSNFYKDRFGVEGNMVLLTFGLLSPNKGIDNVIAALPAVLRQHPNVVYIVLGATHPKVKRHEGETYRLKLQQLARSLGVERNVIFYDQFLPLEDLVEFIGAADIYITPYLNEAQITSGTLAYTVGAGKAVVSTPYWYASELLADGRGVLVPFNDSEVLAERLLELMCNETERHAMRKRAYMFARNMIWPCVAQQYMELFQQVREERSQRPRQFFCSEATQRRPRELPLLKLDHLRQLTDDTGLIQHATFTVPNYNEGYATDDNARALIAAALLEMQDVRQTHGSQQLATRYLAFLWHAYNVERGRFRNMLSYDRRWLEEVGSEDAHGRSLWALGEFLSRSQHPGLCGIASRLFHQALPAALELSYPRSWAFALLGINQYLCRYSGASNAQQVREVLVERLVRQFQEQRSANWPWFEDHLSYDNGKLPHALLRSGREMERDDLIEIGLTALRWILELQRAEQGHFVPIGSHGFYTRGGERARFDQQPIEAQAMISACMEAFRCTGDELWRNEAQRIFDWFLGHNDTGLLLYDPATGGCRDGLHSDRINENQGAESTLAFLLSLLELRLAEHIIQNDMR